MFQEVRHEILLIVIATLLLWAGIIFGVGAAISVLS